MRLNLVFRACWVVGLLAIGAIFAAERKPSLIGATREQVLAQFGEPKSQLVAGNREVLLFVGQRVVLRDSRVVEVEEIPVEATPPPRAPAPAPAKAGAASEVPAATTEEDAGTPPAPAKNAPAPSGAATADAAGTATTTPVAPVRPAEPEVQIKSVRPPSHDLPRAVPAQAVPAANPVTIAPSAVAKPVPTSATTTSSSTKEANVKPSVSSPAATATAPKPSVAVTTPAPVVADRPANTSAEKSTSPAMAPGASAGNAVTSGETDTTTATASSAPADTADVAPVTPPPAKAVKKKRAAEGGEMPDASDAFLTGRTYLIAAVIVLGGIGYLVWRHRQRQLELAATAVSRSPFATETPTASSGTRFTVDLISKLEWKRFEELVASYYNKTGVVASRTKSGPAAPVHIRISWKGEQRPFACVHCIPRAAGLIEPGPINALCEVLAAEDIRRGYVVTSGKFSVPARDIAEEKHITLLPGDIFVEKLNALPDSVRAELMKDATNGDYMTPTCPRCETKMVRAAGDASQWQCPQCGTVLPRV